MTDHQDLIGEAPQTSPRPGQRARHVTELTDEELAMIGAAEVASEHFHLNALHDD
jgi:hypothetical protein